MISKFIEKLVDDLTRNIQISLSLSLESHWKKKETNIGGGDGDDGGGDGDDGGGVLFGRFW